MHSKCTKHSLQFWGFFLDAACAHNGWVWLCHCVKTDVELPDKETSEADLRRQSLQDTQERFF